MVLPVQLAQRINHIDCIGLVEVFMLCDSDPLVELIEIGVVKVLTFGGAVGSCVVCSGWLSN